MIAWFAKLPVMEKIGWSVLGLVLLGFVLAVFYFGLRRILEWSNLKDLEPEDRIGLKIEIIKTAASILGGVFFLLTLLFTYQNLRLTEEKNRADLLMDQERHRTDLFVKAINQLGSDKLEVRLGGIYALERIAWDSEKDHWPIMEVLTAYLRENAPWPPENPASSKKNRPWANAKMQGRPQPRKGGTKERAEIPVKLDTDVQAVLSVIGRRNPTFAKREKQPLDLAETDLRGADPWKAKLEKAILWKAHLEKAIFCETRLEGAILDEAHLGGHSLIKPT